MSGNLSPAEIGKFLSAKGAMRFVEPDMKLGLGTGSTAAWLVKLLAHTKRTQGLNFTAVATSYATTELATSLGIEIRGLDEVGQLDLTIDGADEFDPALNLIKGGGAALLQEKIVATASDRMVVITDKSKRVGTLGAFPLPVEVVQFGFRTTQRLIAEMLSDQDVQGRRVTVRMAGDQPLVTDEGHHILDLHLEKIGDPHSLTASLAKIAGVVEDGLFLGIADAVVVGHGDGRLETQFAGRPDWQVEDIDLQAEAALLAALAG